MNIKNGMLLFWNGLYSQWYGSEFREDGKLFYTAEHYMMYHKALLFGDVAIANKILVNRQPRNVKSLGRKVKNFDKVVWRNHCIDIVTQGNYLKFTQNPELLKDLLKYKHLEMVEASPLDNIWGIGLSEDNPKAFNRLTWEGENLLGVCIMKARKRILAEQEALKSC